MEQVCMGLHACHVLSVSSFFWVNLWPANLHSFSNNFSSAFVSCLCLCPLSLLLSVLSCPLIGTQPLMMTQEEVEKAGEKGKSLWHSVTAMMLLLKMLVNKLKIAGLKDDYAFNFAWRFALLTVIMGVASKKLKQLLIYTADKTFAQLHSPRNIKNVYLNVIWIIVC